MKCPILRHRQRNNKVILSISSVARSIIFSTLTSHLSFTVFLSIIYSVDCSEDDSIPAVPPGMPKISL